LSGGTAPLTKSHRVIDSPLSVSRVMPPTTTIANTSAATANSQLAMAAGRGRRSAGAPCEGSTDSMTPRLCARPG
jgi:hypothetical protein